MSSDIFSTKYIELCRNTPERLEKTNQRIGLTFLVMLCLFNDKFLIAYKYFQKCKSRSIWCLCLNEVQTSMFCVCFWHYTKGRIWGKSLKSVSRLILKWKIKQGFLVFGPEIVDWLSVDGVGSGVACIWSANLYWLFHYTIYNRNNRWSTEKVYLLKKKRRVYDEKRFYDERFYRRQCTFQHWKRKILAYIGYCFKFMHSLVYQKRPK